MMTIIVNGEAREFAEQLSIADLLAKLQVNLPHVAVELNRDVVPRAQHPDIVLKEGDELEVVTLVGGG